MCICNSSARAASRRVAVRVSAAAVAAANENESDEEARPGADSEPKRENSLGSKRRSASSNSNRTWRQNRLHKKNVFDNLKYFLASDIVGCKGVDELQVKADDCFVETWTKSQQEGNNVHLTKGTLVTKT